MSQLTNFEFNFGDRRLNDRALHCLDTFLARDLTKGFPGIFSNQYELKAFYRLMNNPKTSPAKIIQGSWPSMSDYFRGQHDEDQRPVVIRAYQDSSAAKYKSRKKLDLGYLQTNSKQDNGFFFHTTIFCDEAGHPRGIFDQQFIQRARSDFGKSRDRAGRAFVDKESFKWVAWLDKLKVWRQALDYPTRIITIADREGDILEVMKALRADEVDFILRSRHDRSVDKQTSRLHDRLRTDEKLDRFVVERKLHSRSSQKYYQAACELRYGAFQLAGLSGSVQGIYLKEVQHNEWQEQAEWFLITSCPLTTPAQVLAVVDDYSQRWSVTEDFHMSLKTGAKMEKRQFDSSAALFNAIALLSHAALHIMALRYIGRENPDESLEESGLISDPIIYRLLPQLARRYLTKRDLDFCRPNTVNWFHLMLARMGGHQGYAQKGWPGWRVLWGGYQELAQLVNGAKLYDQSTYG